MRSRRHRDVRPPLPRSDARSAGETNLENGEIPYIRVASPHGVKHTMGNPAAIPQLQGEHGVEIGIRPDVVAQQWSFEAVRLPAPPDHRRLEVVRHEPGLDALERVLQRSASDL